jgi:hypothetical protein
LYSRGEAAKPYEIPRRRAPFRQRKSDIFGPRRLPFRVRSAQDPDVEADDEAISAALSPEKDEGH